MLPLKPRGRSQVVGRWCTVRIQSSLSLRTMVCHHNTRTCVRLLGPCFKTGRLKPFCQPATTPRQRAQVSPVFSFRWNLPPIWGCNPKQPDSSRACRTGQPAATDGPLTLYGSPVPRNFDRGWPRSHFSKLQFACVPTGDSKFELFPLHSPLLRESLLVSFPPLINMLKFSG